MPKAKRYLLAGYVLVILAILFVVYALNNPQGSFPWSNTITYAIYTGYGLLTVFLFVLAGRHRGK